MRLLLQVTFLRRHCSSFRKTSFNWELLLYSFPIALSFNFSYLLRDWLRRLRCSRWPVSLKIALHILRRSLRVVIFLRSIIVSLRLRGEVAGVSCNIGEIELGYFEIGTRVSVLVFICNKSRIAGRTPRQSATMTITFYHLASMFVVGEIIIVDHCFNQSSLLLRVSWAINNSSLYSFTSNNCRGYHLRSELLIWSCARCEASLRLLLRMLRQSLRRHKFFFLLGCLRNWISKRKHHISLLGHLISELLELFLGIFWRLLRLRSKAFLKFV